MDCTSCGTTLQPETTICPRCGTRISYDNNIDEVAYVEYSSTQAKSNTQPSNAAQEIWSPLKDIQSYGEAQRVLNYEQPSPVPQAPQQRQSLSAVTMLLLIILVAFVVVGGSDLVYYAAVLHPNELGIQATAVARTVLTMQAQSTIEANAHATATTAALTLEQIYTKATSGTPVINDPLSNRESSIWYHSDGPNNSCDFNEGAYHLKGSLKGKSTFCLAYDSFFKNLAFQVHMTIIQAGEVSAGLAFHINNGFSSLYLFLLDQSGSYGFYVAKDNGVTSLASGTNAAINVGLNQPNLLTVIAYDGSIYLYVNKQSVAHISDSSYSSGQIGLFVEGHTSPVDVAFNNAQVWSI